MAIVPRPPDYQPASATSRTALLSLALGAHAALLVALLSLGSAVVAIREAPLLVALLAQPPGAQPPIPTRSVPLPHFRQPEIVIPDPPRFETLAAVQVVERPAPPPPAVAPIVAGPSIDARVEAPRFDLAYLNNPAPSYPTFAKKAREQGRVLLRVRVDAMGNVSGVEVYKTSGFARLDEAALAAVKRWRFVPARSGEQPIPGVALVPVDFQLEG